MIRRGTVQGIDASGNLEVRPIDSQAGDEPLPAPFLGSTTTGLHTMPPQGAQVATLYEADGRAIAHLSATERAGGPVLGLSETCIYGPDGATLSHMTATGALVLASNAAGTVKLTLDRTTGVLMAFWPGGSKQLAP